MRVGTSVPGADFGPITRSMLAEYAEASGDNNELHLSDAAARRSGHPEVIAQGMLSMAFVGRWVTSWCLLRGVQSISSRFTAPTPLGSHLRCEGLVRSRESGLLMVDYTVAIDGSGVITLKGVVVVAERDCRLS